MFWGLEFRGLEFRGLGFRAHATNFPDPLKSFSNYNRVPLLQGSIRAGSLLKGFYSDCLEEFPFAGCISYCRVRHTI